ncbi:hypothetical protein [Catenuloplanes japonicus]|uniref:hypothetical protein n=1 Tax=Catenuloplanes japonicus TaxID=33876 RepID=UPI000525377F|nr:hypothetical protein [Catenuloplanes japonicus]
MGAGADEAASARREVRNQITDGTVHGPVIQAGSFTGHIHYHFPPGRPPDLLTLRLWVDRVAADYRTLVSETGEPAGGAHLRGLDLVLAGLDSGAASGRGAGRPEGEGRGDVVRRLVVAGIVRYLASPGPPPDEPVIEQILLDLIVFSLWPVVTAQRLPPGWQGELAQLTSPRLAALVARERAKARPAAEAFARTVADRSFSSAMVTLFDDLADPRRGGALLTAMAVAGGLPAPPAGPRNGRRVAAWTLGIAGGAVLAEALKHHPSRHVQLLGETATALSVTPLDPPGPGLLDLVDWLLG